MKHTLLWRTRIKQTEYENHESVSTPTGGFLCAASENSITDAQYDMVKGIQQKLHKSICNFITQSVILKILQRILMTNGQLIYTSINLC